MKTILFFLPILNILIILLFINNNLINFSLWIISDILNDILIVFYLDIIILILDFLTSICSSFNSDTTSLISNTIAFLKTDIILNPLIISQHMSFQIFLETFTLFLIKRNILKQPLIVDHFIITIVFGEFNDSSYRSYQQIASEVIAETQ